MDYLALLGFGIAGLYIWFAPTERLLKNDYGLAKIYYWRAKDKDVGLKKAREYYTKLGKIFVFVSIAGLLIKLFFVLLSSAT
ncbi:hypothetical protein H5162_20615 [Pseudoalteromonas sp. SR41-8]|uniref:Uncharacterized protein n=1 Tax=Pseudoalteromonas rhizosphaerae TaxID=2518973 RepID=A0ABW8KXG9_9GAMM|nr:MULTISPECIES: hypothetical protein [unclassified Pseudoalteromonas]MBB1311815.1 hypothetical protein [Pseudoalteromonas sp. SR41-8]MBB1420095.1 hypothetical protein [Pseudoalteromonas sp. SG44-1]MBB1480492.1 hypothetical protein [Pseudoalteromonas sp. SG41-2]